MSNSERRKGAAGELEVAAIFRAAGFDCDRTPNSGGLRVKGDLAGTVPAHVEVKRQETLRLPLWIRQAAADAPAGLVPIVAYRQSRGRWLAVLPTAALSEYGATATGEPLRPFNGDSGRSYSVIPLALLAALMAERVAV